MISGKNSDQCSRNGSCHSRPFAAGTVNRYFSTAVSSTTSMLSDKSEGVGGKRDFISEASLCERSQQLHFRRCYTRNKVIGKEHRSPVWEMSAKCGWFFGKFQIRRAPREYHSGSLLTDDGKARPNIPFIRRVRSGGVFSRKLCENIVDLPCSIKSLSRNQCDFIQTRNRVR